MGTRLKQFSMERGRLKLNFTVVILNEDICVTISGGDAHIGAVALSIPKDDYSKKCKPELDVSVFTVKGHKDNIIAEQTARKVSLLTSKKAVVICGIHYEKITAEEIRDIMKLAEEAVTKIIDMNGEGSL